jgi:hypothetical protein
MRPSSCLVGVILEPSGRESTKICPIESADGRILSQRPMLRLKQVEQSSQISSSKVQQASLANFGHIRKLAASSLSHAKERNHV